MAIVQERKYGLLLQNISDILGYREDAESSFEFIKAGWM